MIRIWLSFSVSGLVLLVGIYTACVQSENHARGAELHELQLQSEWFLRRATQLRVDLEGQRFGSSALEALRAERGLSGEGRVDGTDALVPEARAGGLSTP